MKKTLLWRRIRASDVFTRILVSWEAAITQEEWDFATDLPVGEILRRTRVHYGQSLADVESTLRIRAQLLEALETGHAEKLPGRVYAIGFVRSYAEYLGLDGDRMVHLFKLQSGEGARPELHFPAPSSESRAPAPFILIGCAVLVLAILTLWVVFGRGTHRADEATPPPPETILRTTLPASLPPAPDSPEPTRETEAVFAIVEDPLHLDTEPMDPEPMDPDPIIEEPPAERSPPAIVLRARESAWTEIRDAQGRAILSRTLRQGDVYKIPPEDGLVLATGNAGGLEIEMDGVILPPLGRTGDVRRNISLNPEDLQKSLENTSP